jgi:hypothetical protein
MKLTTRLGWAPKAFVSRRAPRATLLQRLDLAVAHVLVRQGDSGKEKSKGGPPPPDCRSEEAEYRCTLADRRTNGTREGKEVEMRPEHFDVAGDQGYFRPAGTMSLGEVVKLVDDALAFARREGVRKLLVDTRAVYGFDSPCLADRYGFIGKWAFTINGAVRLALVARPEMIDPNKFGVTVAANRGATADVFASETEATAWLNPAL